MVAKTIVVTGANGLLGQKLVQKLSRRDAVQLIATGLGADRNPLAGEGYEYVQMDITDPAQVEAVFNTYKPTEIINTAAMTNVDQCEKEKEQCWALNVEAVKIQLAQCAQHGTRMVHISTDFIFDGENGPYSEKDKPNPVSYYGESKLAAEQAILESGIPYSILRTMLVYGLVADMSRSNFVLWAKGALEKGNPINVVDDQFRCATLAEDLAEGVALATMKNKSGIYNISGPDMHSIFEMVQMVAAHWKLDADLIKPVKSETLNQPAKRPPKTGFIILKAQSELGYKPHSFKDGLSFLDKQMQDLGL